MITISPEQPSTDADAIEALFDATFGPGHFAKTAERLREYSQSIPALNRVAKLDGEIIGVCRVWPLRVGGEPALFYGPVAVAPAHQGDRLGLQVTADALRAGRGARWPAALLIGAPRYFSEIGFETVPAQQFHYPGPQDAARLMAADLDRSWKTLSGAVRAAPELLAN